MRTNTPLFRLFLVLIVPYLVRGSSPSTDADMGSVKLEGEHVQEQPVPLIKKTSKLLKRKSATDFLQDSSDRVKDVQPEDVSVQVLNLPQKSHGPQPNEQFKTLIDQGKYNEMEESLGLMRREEFMKGLFPIITTVEHFKGLYEFLDSHEMLTDFFMVWNMDLVTEVITEFVKSNTFSDIYSRIHRAIVSSLEKAHHVRAFGLMEAVRQGTAEKDALSKQNGSPLKLDRLFDDLFIDFYVNVHTAPLKQALTLHKEEFGEKHHVILDIFCQKLVHYLLQRTPNPSNGKLLKDMVGQPSLLDSTAFADSIMSDSAFAILRNNTKYCWKEAIEDGLNRGHSSSFLLELTDLSSIDFSGNLPTFEEVRKTILEKFPTKQAMEEAWRNENVPIFFEKLEGLKLYLLPSVLVKIISEYAITWVVV